MGVLMFGDDMCPSLSGLQILLIGFDLLRVCWWTRNHL